MSLYRVTFDDIRTCEVHVWAQSKEDVLTALRSRSDAAVRLFENAYEVDGAYMNEQVEEAEITADNAGTYLSLFPPGGES